MLSRENERECSYCGSVFYELLSNCSQCGAPLLPLEDEYVLPAVDPKWARRKGAYQKAVEAVPIEQWKAAVLRMSGSYAKGLE